MLIYFRVSYTREIIFILRARIMALLKLKIYFLGETQQVQDQILCKYRFLRNWVINVNASDNISRFYWFQNSILIDHSQKCKKKTPSKKNSPVKSTQTHILHTYQFLRTQIKLLSCQCPNPFLHFHFNRFSITTL